MKRDVLITVLLVLAGIILAIALFGAGALWKSRNSPRRSTNAAPIDRLIAHRNNPHNY